MMDKYALLKKRPRACLRVYGLHFEELEALLRKVQIAHLKKLEENPISKRGQKAEFSFENQFLLTLEYLRSYQTFEAPAFSYGISESYANKCFHKLLGLLAEEIGLKNPEKVSFKKVKKALVDVACQPIEPPLKEQEKSYNAHKKKYLAKSQIVVNQKNGEIVHCVVEMQGAKSDLRVLPVLLFEAKKGN